MKRTLNAFFLIIFSFSALSAADFSKLETTTARELAARQATLSFEIPTPQQPLTYTRPPVFGRYDYTGIPLYVFTETTRVSGVLVKAMNTVNYTLDVALYNLQLPDAAQALVRARDRGVKVRVMIDYDHVFPNVGRDIKYLIDSGMDLKVMKGRGGSGSMHNKYAVLDGKMLINGAYNWSDAAEQLNAENAIFTTDPAYVGPYLQEYNKLFGLGKPGYN